MTDTLNKIKEKFAQLTELKNRLEQRRTTWLEKKPAIAAMFEEYISMGNSEGFSLAITEDDSISNYESIGLAFDATTSGIVTKENNIQHLKIGGSLVFNLLPTGFVGVYITYPYVDGILSQPSNKILVSDLEPRELTAEVIENYIGEFFDELVKFEK